MPITWILATLLGGIVSKDKHRKKRMLITSALLLLVLSNPFLMNSWMTAWEVAPVEFASVSKHDIGIVLTGLTNLQKAPTDRVYFNKGADRVYHALLLYNKKKISKILITGGNLGFDPDNKERKESEMLKTYFLNSGVPEKDIILETKAQNTHQNASLTKEKLEELGLLDKKLVLITSAFHMRRSIACFEKVGLKITPFPGDYYTTDGVSWEDFIPDQGELSTSAVILHEWFGFAVYKIMGYV